MGLTNHRELKELDKMIYARNRRVLKPGGRVIVTFNQYAWFFVVEEICILPYSLSTTYCWIRHYGTISVECRGFSRVQVQPSSFGDLQCISLIRSCRCLKPNMLNRAHSCLKSLLCLFSSVGMSQLGCNKNISRLPCSCTIRVAGKSK